MEGISGEIANYKISRNNNLLSITIDFGTYGRGFNITSILKEFIKINSSFNLSYSYFALNSNKGNACIARGGNVISINTLKPWTVGMDESIYCNAVIVIV